MYLNARFPDSPSNCLSAQSLSHWLTPLPHISPRWISSSQFHDLAYCHSTKCHLYANACQNSLFLSFSSSPSLPPYPSPLSQSPSWLSDRYLDLKVTPKSTWVDYPLSETSFPPGFFMMIIVSPTSSRYPVSIP